MNCSNAQWQCLHSCKYFSFLQITLNFASVASVLQFWSVQTDAIFRQYFSVCRPEEETQLYKVKKETEKIWRKVTH